MTLWIETTCSAVYAVPTRLINVLYLLMTSTCPLIWFLLFLYSNLHIVNGYGGPDVQLSTVTSDTLMYTSSCSAFQPVRCRLPKQSSIQLQYSMIHCSCADFIQQVIYGQLRKRRAEDRADQSRGQCCCCSRIGSDRMCSNPQGFRCISRRINHSAAAQRVALLEANHLVSNYLEKCKHSDVHLS